MSKELENFMPEDKVLYLKPIKKARGLFLDSNNPEAFLFGNSRIKFSLPRDRQGNLINPFKSKSEQAWLEKQLDADMNIYKKMTENYWAKYKLVLGKEKRKLDLNNPKDYLDYIVARTLDKYIATNGKSGTYTRTQIYELVEEDHENEVKASKADKTKEAYMLFGKLEAKGKEEMLNFLKVYGKRVDKNSKIEYLKATIDTIIQEDMDKFISLAKDQDFTIKLLIEDAVQVGVLIKSNREYLLPGGDKLAPEGLKATIDVATKYLKDKSNQDLLISIQQQVKTAKD
jgi:hypothetical protein